MSMDPMAIKLRTKIIGAKLRNARLKSGKSIEACGEMVGLDAGDYEEIELGFRKLSLPELELLSYYLDVPLDTFLDREQLENQKSEKVTTQASRWIRIRQRMIGAMLQQARQESGISKEELAGKLHLELTTLEGYEMGLDAVPLPILEAITGELNHSIRDFEDQKGFVGLWNAQQRILNEYLGLPPDLQAFISKPINRPYLELALKLSEMPVDRLRSIAEGLLEITF